MYPGAVMVTRTRVPTGSFFFRNGLRRLSLERALVVLIVRAFGQRFCWSFLLFVLHVTRTRAPAGSVVDRQRCVLRVNFRNASQLLVTVDGIRLGGGGGGGGAAPTLIVTVASLPLPVPSLAR